MTTPPSRFALAALVMVMLAACSGTGADPLATGAVTPSAVAAAPDTESLEPGNSPASVASAEPAAAAAEPVSFKGSGIKKTKSFTFHTPARIDWTHAGSGNIIVSIDGSENVPVGFLVNDIGKGKGTTWVYGEGDGQKVHFNVIGSGKWTLKASYVPPAVKPLPVSYKGTTGMTTTPFHVEGDATLSLSHKGTGNFVVTLVDVATGLPNDLVANEIGKVNSETEVYGLSGDYALSVTADGAWTVSIGQ